ncbi:MAG: hypothetical protein V1861_05415 [Candidatus Micrarchaeota archaeon]
MTGPIARGQVEGRLAASMARAGFPLAKHAPLHERPIGKALYQDNELIFNRALDGKSSSFCVLATCESDGSVTVHWYNPDPNGAMLKKEEYLRKTLLPPGASEDMVAAVVNKVCEDAAKKKPNQMFLDPHSHFGSMCPPIIGPDGNTARWGNVKYDDGVSYLTDNLRKALFYHIDYYALTTHNSFSKTAFDFMSWAGHWLGFLPVPATELTAPLKEPNGPHFLVLMKNANVGDYLTRGILSRREHLDMPSYFSGMGMEEMLDVLFSLQKSNLAALGIAHPVNFNSPGLPVPIVGLYTAVDSGALSLDQAHMLAQRFDMIAMWNPSLHTKADEVRIESPQLKSFLRKVNQKHIGNRRLWANQTNYALAQELHECFGIYTHFETDEHKTLPFIRDAGGKGYVLGGDSLAMGMTVIEAPAETFKGRMSVPELIDMIRTRAVEMHGKVFAVTRPEAITVHAERAAIPDQLRRVARRAGHALTRRYAGMLVRDFFDLLFSGELDDIGNMSGG